MKLLLKSFIKIKLLILLSLTFLSNVKFLNNGEVIIAYSSPDNKKNIKTIETKDIKKSFRFGFTKFNLMKNSFISLDDKKNIFLERGVIVFSNNEKDEVNYKLFFNNCWGEAQFLRIESSKRINDLSSDVKIKYYYDDKEWVINTYIHPIFYKAKKFYYGFFIPYSIFHTIYKVKVNITIFSGNKKYSEIKFEQDVKSKEWSKQKIKFNPKKSKTLQEVRREKFEQERKKRWKVWEKVGSTVYFRDGFDYPVEDRKYLTSDFALTREWVLYNGKLYSKDVHSGIDYADIKGTPIYACASGYVRYAENGEYVGNMIIIEHGLGLCSGYMHLNEILVKQDQFVKKGEEIGKVGATGATTGSHIHWETRIYGIAIDPRILLNIDEIFKITE